VNLLKAPNTYPLSHPFTATATNSLCRCMAHELWCRGSRERLLARGPIIPSRVICCCCCRLQRKRLHPDHDPLFEVEHHGEVKLAISLFSLFVWIPVKLRKCIFLEGHYHHILVMPLGNENGNIQWRQQTTSSNWQIPCSFFVVFRSVFL
jgi:hypothetical protein